MPIHKDYLDRNIYVDGSGTSGGTTYYTTANTVSAPGGCKLGIATTNSNQKAICNIIIPSGSVGIYTTDPNEELEVVGDDFIIAATIDPVTISDSSVVLEIEFPTQNTLDFDPNDMPGNVVF